MEIASAAQPYLRYRVGRTSNLLIMLKRLLPELVFEAMRRRIFQTERAVALQPIEGNLRS